MDLILVTRRFTLADGTTPAKGSVTFQLSAPLEDPDGNVVATTKEITKTLVDGALSQTLVATNSPGLQPNGVVYIITERLVPNYQRQYRAEIPYDAEGGTIDLADIAPVVDSTITYGVTLAAFDAHTALTTGVHGIADTSALETTTGAQGKADAAQAAAITAAATDATTKANAAQAAAESAAASGLAAHEADTAGVHGIADTAQLARKDTAATITAPWDFTGGITENGNPIGGFDPATAQTISAPWNFTGGLTRDGAALASARDLYVEAIIALGNAAVGDNVLPPGFRVPFATTLRSLFARAGTGPSGGQVTIEVNRNGSVIGTVTIGLPSLWEGLLSYWKLDEASGTRNDSIGTNHLADNNTVTSIAGIQGNAAQFATANSEYLSHADAPSLQYGDVDWTVALWVSLASKTGNPGIFAKDAGSIGGREVRIDYQSTVDRFRAYVFNASGLAGQVVADNFGAPSLGTPYLLIVEHNAAANQLSISVNNGTANVGTTTATPAVSVAPLTIGAYDTGGSPHFWDGWIDEAARWNRLLTTAEKAAIYNAGVGTTYGGSATEGETTGLAVPLEAGDILTWDLTSVGSSTPGADIAVAMLGS